jgi:hypothetical protein
VPEGTLTRLLGLLKTDEPPPSDKVGNYFMYFISNHTQLREAEAIRTVIRVFVAL